MKKITNEQALKSAQIIECYCRQQECCTTCVFWIERNCCTVSEDGVKTYLAFQCDDCAIKDAKNPSAISEMLAEKYKEA